MSIRSAPASRLPTARARSRAICCPISTATPQLYTSGLALGSSFYYDPYGVTLSGSSASTAVPWRFQGRLTESASGQSDLYDFGARSYDPGLGAFTSLDTVAGGISNPISLNRYLYAEANPGTLTDPSGHCTRNNPDCTSNAELRATIKNDDQVHRDAAVETAYTNRRPHASPVAATVMPLPFSAGNFKALPSCRNFLDCAGDFGGGFVNRAVEMGSDSAHMALAGTCGMGCVARLDRDWHNKQQLGIKALGESLAKDPLRTINKMAAQMPGTPQWQGRLTDDLRTGDWEDLGSMGADATAVIAPEAATAAIARPADLTALATARARIAATEAVESGEPLTLRGKLPTATGVSISARTGIPYTGYSGMQTELPRVLEGIVPASSRTPWPVFNCAEIGCIAAALANGERIKDLVTVVVRTDTGETMAPCKNCMRWVPRAK